MATGRITKKVLDYIAHINKEAKQMNYVKELKKSVEHGKNGTQKYVIKEASSLKANETILGRLKTKI